MKDEQKPTSDFLGEELRSINEVASTLDEKAGLITDLAFRVFVENRVTHTDYDAREYTFLPKVHGILYKLPNHPNQVIEALPERYFHGESVEGNAKVMPSFVTRGLITAEGQQVIHSDQQSLLELSKGKENVVMAILSDCAVIVGENNDSLFFAHIGYGEIGNIQNVLTLLKEKGVDIKKLVAVVMERPEATDIGWNKTVTKEDLLEMGFIESNITVGHSEFVEETQNGKKLFGHNNILQVTATPEFVTVQSFDYRDKSGFEGRIPYSVTAHDAIKVFTLE